MRKVRTISTSNSSPTSWPKVSLTDLKWSRSMIARVHGDWLSWWVCKVVARSMSNARRFNAWVSGSWIARCSSAWRWRVDCSEKMKAHRVTSTPLLRNTTRSTWLANTSGWLPRMASTVTLAIIAKRRLVIRKLVVSTA